MAIKRKIYLLNKVQIFKPQQQMSNHCKNNCRYVFYPALSVMLNFVVGNILFTVDKINNI